MKYTVGLTGAGCPGASGIVNALSGYDIIGFDSNVDGVAMSSYMVGVTSVLPGTDGKYLLDLIPKLSGIDVLLPCTSDELLPLALAVEDGSITCPVAVSCSDAIRTANNKFKLSEMFSEHTPETALLDKREAYDIIEDLGYHNRKVIVKPSEGSGSRGLMIVDKDAHKVFFGRKPEEAYYTIDEAVDRLKDGVEYVFQEFIEGKEYSVDCYFSDSGNFAVPRIRHKVRSGIAFDTEIDMNQTELIELSLMFGERLGLKYCAGFQFIIDNDTKKPYLIECNPRVQGSMPIVTSMKELYSYNPFSRAIEECLGNKVPDIQDLGFLHGLRMKRVWGGIITRYDKLIREF